MCFIELYFSAVSQRSNLRSTLFESKAFVKLEGPLCCSALQYVAVCCSLLQCVVLWRSVARRQIKIIFVGLDWI